MSTATAEQVLVRKAIRRLNRQGVIGITAASVAEEVARHITSRRYRGTLPNVIYHRDLVALAHDELRRRYR